MSETIRVLIVDNHEMVRKGLEAMLKTAPDLILVIGYLLKNIPAGQLPEAIRNAYAGRSTLAPEAAQSFFGIMLMGTDCSGCVW